MSTILTHSGRLIDVADLRPEDISLGDVASALSMLCRYGGHCHQFYSVAEHCYHVAHAVPAEHFRVGLMHDAAEAYVGDVVGPLKRFLPDFRTMEAFVWRSVSLAFKLPAVLPNVVKDVDKRIQIDEMAQLWPDTPAAPDDGNAVGVRLQFWPPAEAEQMFLEAYHQRVAA